MGIPRKLRPTRLRVAVAALVAALVATFAGAAGALACLPPPPLDGRIEGFRLLAGPGGDPAVTWSEYRRNPAETARAATLTGGTWMRAEPGGVTGPGAQGVPSGAAVSEVAGAAVAVWQQGQAILAASRSAVGAFGPWQLVADEPEGMPGGFFMNPTGSLGPGGHAVALWVRSVLQPPLGAAPVQQTERRVVRAADRAPDGSWSAPYDLASGATRPHVVTSCGPWRSEQPAVAIDAAGAAVAVWESWLPEYDKTATMWAARPAGGTWSAADLLTAGTAYGVRLAMDARGTAHAAWIEDRTLRSARRPAGGAFGPADVVGSAAGTAVALQVDSAGRSVAVWKASPTQLSAATRPADGAWSAPVDLTALEPQIGPQIADPLPTPSLLQEVRISRQTMRRPPCALQERPARRACRMAGAALTFRLTAPAEVRVTVQRRGRGRALRGLRIAAAAGDHRVVVGARPLPPGRYTVRIRATAEGQAPEAASKQLTVRPA